LLKKPRNSKKIFFIVLFCSALSFYLGAVSVKQHPNIKRKVRTIVASTGFAATSHWNQNDFKKVNIPSTVDNDLQHAYFHESDGNSPRPLLVSLHTWTGDYAEQDPLAPLATQDNWNYIHPDFRGPNWSKQACLSNLVTADIDDAIQFAMDNATVDTDNIFIVGVSGGGYAILGTFMRTRHQVKRFLSWNGISNLSTWYRQSKSRDSSFAQDVIDCTSNTNQLDPNEAKKRSPLFFPMPATTNGTLELFAGIHDGYNGPVPISHSILFFNRLVTEFGRGSKRVGEVDFSELLTRAVKVASNLGNLGSRRVIYKKEIPEVSLTIFDGGHEILPKYCFARLKQLARE
jgi:pimeloyl-ACP methyl ester carboxylesterase